MTERRNLWVIRLVALAIAVALWFFLSWEKRERQSERVIEASVTFDTVGDMTVLDPVRQIDVRVRGGTQRVRTLNPGVVNVVVELEQTEPGAVDVALAPDSVYVPEGFTVVSLDPNSLHLTLDRMVTKTLPVQVNLVGEPAAGAAAGTPVAMPPAVAVRAPASRIRDVTLVMTGPVTLNGHAQTFDELAPVLSPDPLASVDPSLVRVRVPMQPPQLSTEALVPNRNKGGRQ